MTVSLRVPITADAPELATLLLRNRQHFRSGEPRRAEDYYTPEVQARLIEDAQRAREAGTGYLFLIDDGGALVGRAGLSSVIRGAFQSASVSYLIDARHTGRGIATAALRELTKFAFYGLGLHRLQGETLVDNVASQRVLKACGFERYGVARGYLRIDGEWRDHELYQLLNPAWQGDD